MSFVDVLAVHAATKPAKPAVIEGDRTTDFQTLNLRANRVANVLVGLGCQVQDRVASMWFNSTGGFEVSHGLRKAGLVGTPINYRLRGPEVAYVLNDSGARIVFADDAHVEAVEAARPDVKGDVRFVVAGERVLPGWLSYAELMRSASDEPPPPPEEITGLGPSMIYTSGTTGHPKGTWRPNGVNVENVAQMISIFELTDSDVHLICGPGYHSAVAMFSALHHLLGSTVVVQPKFEAGAALDMIERHRVTTTMVAPTLLHRLVDAQEAQPRDLSSLRAIFLGAAPCPYALKARAEKVIGQVLCEFYGATETGVNTVLRPEDQLRKPGSCGQAVPGQEIRLVGAGGVTISSATPGSISGCATPSSIIPASVRQPRTSAAPTRRPRRPR